MRQPGFEPGSHSWEPYMITPTPQALTPLPGSNPPAPQHLIGIETPSAPQPLVGIEPQDSVGSNPWDRNPRDWRNGDRSCPNGIETLDSAFAVDRQKKRHQEDSNFRGRIPSRFLIYRLNHAAMVPTVEVLPGFEPGSPDSESEVLTSYTIRPGTPGGTRTHNLTLRRGTRYPLRYGG